MSLVAYTITALERDTADADASGKQVIVGATCSMFIQPANTAVQLFDNAAGANGSTAKTTNSSGQVTVYVNPGVYRVSVNGSDSFVTIANDADAVFDSVVIDGVNVVDDLAPKESPVFTGNVGIGTASPDARLEVVDNLEVSGLNPQLRIRANTTGACSLFFGDSTSANVGQIAYSNASDFMNFVTNGAEKMRIDASGNVGIGTATPSFKLDVWDTGDFGVRLFRNDGVNNGRLEINQDDLGVEFKQTYSSGAGNLRFATGSTEAIRIDLAGNVGIGTTSPSTTLEVNSGAANSVANFASTDDQAYVSFKDNATTGFNFVAVGAQGNDMILLAGAGEKMRIDSIGTILPGVNGTQDLGSSSLRFDTLFATNGTINTSDINEKQDIESLNAAETRVAQNCKTLLRKFRWRDMVEEKGDDARIHFGIIAQELDQAFTDEGLDAGRYGMFTSDTWIDDESGDEVTRMGVRYTELLAFIIAAI